MNKKDLKPITQKVAIEFADFCAFNYQPTAEIGEWYDHHHEGNTGEHLTYTTEELWAKYLKDEGTNYQKK